MRMKMRMKMKMKMKLKTKKDERMKSNPSASGIDPVPATRGFHLQVTREKPGLKDSQSGTH